MDDSATPKRTRRRPADPAPPPAVFMAPVIPPPREPDHDPAVAAAVPAETPSARKRPPSSPSTATPSATARQSRPAEPGVRTAAGSDATIRPWWATAITNPGYAPELLILAAVHQSHLAARERHDWLSSRYPGAPAEALASIMLVDSRRFAAPLGVAAALANGRSLSGNLAAALTAALGGEVMRVQLALGLAAAYGQDLADVDARTIDVLVLLRIHDNRVAARTALDSARGGASPDSNARLIRLARQLARPAATQAVALLFPGTALVAGVLSAVNNVNDVAVRARQLYQTR